MCRIIGPQKETTAMTPAAMNPGYHTIVIGYKPLKGCERICVPVLDAPK
jgi:hypothetical protein